MATCRYDKNSTSICTYIRTSASILNWTRIWKLEFQSNKGARVPKAVMVILLYSSAIWLTTETFQHLILSVSLLQCVTECIGTFKSWCYVSGALKTGSSCFVCTALGLGIIVPQTRRQSIYVNNVGPWNAIKYIGYHDTDRLFGLAVFLNPLNPSLKTAFSIHMPLTHHISISVEVLTPKLNPFPLPALINRLMILTSSTHQQACNSQHYLLSYSLSMQSGQEVAHPVQTMPLLKPSLAATMCMSPCGWPHPPPAFPPPPVPPFLLTQNPRASTWRLPFLHSTSDTVQPEILAVN